MPASPTLFPAWLAIWKKIEGHYFLKSFFKRLAGIQGPRRIGASIGNLRRLDIYDVSPYLSPPSSGTHQAQSILRVFWRNRACTGCVPQTARRN